MLSPWVTIGGGAVVDLGNVLTKDALVHTFVFDDPCRVVCEMAERNGANELLAEVGLG